MIPDVYVWRRMVIVVHQDDQSTLLEGMRHRWHLPSLKFEYTHLDLAMYSQRLDLPIHVQYGRWIGGILLRGTLGGTAAWPPAMVGRGRLAGDGCFSGVPQASPEALEGPQRAAVRPTRTVNGLRTAKLRRMTALERAMRPDRRRDGAHGGRDGPERNRKKNRQLPLDVFAQVSEGRVSGNERMRTMPDDTTQRRHRLAPHKPTPEAPGRSIPPIRSDLVGAADTLLAATPPARPILAYPPPKRKRSG